MFSGPIANLLSVLVHFDENPFICGMLMQNNDNKKDRRKKKREREKKKTKKKHTLVSEFHILHLPFTSLSFLNDGAAGAAEKGLICVINGVVHACVACVTSW